MTSNERASTLGELKQSGWRSRSVRDEMRDNLIGHLRRGEPIFPGIIGFERTVIPQIQNAILAGHSFILLGLRGQAKTRLVRSLPRLLDEALPVIAGTDLNDDPLAPVSVPARRMVAELGDETPIAWLGREDRYREKLATPDVTIADLIGDVDPIKAASRRLEFGDPEVIHYGLLPRANRGIFAVNELPDLQARIQVGLLNVLEEGDVQVRGFPMRMPLDVCLVFTANPEDYTNRGRIITPLRDRIASQVTTHYPVARAEAMQITDQEAWTGRAGGPSVRIPDWLREMVDQVAFEARANEYVDQSSGVSARMTISLLEVVVSNAERRGLITGEDSVVARVADLLAAASAVSGKVELVYDGEREGMQAVSDLLLGKAVKTVFDERFPDAYAEGVDGRAPAYEAVVAWFSGGRSIDLSDEQASASLLATLRTIGGLEDVVSEHAECPDDEVLAATMELVLEGLAQSALLARQPLEAGRRYADMLTEMAQGLEG